MPIISINNANIYYELHGQGQPLILIAGYCATHIAWVPLLNELSKTFQVLIFDNRAVGQTTDDGKPLTMSLLAQDVIELSGQLGLKRPHVVGHSMGGMITQAVAANYPDKISKIGLLACAAKVRPVAFRGFQTILNMRERGIEIDLIINAVLPWLFSDIFLNQPKNITQFKQNILENPFPQSLADQTRQFNLLATHDGETQLKHIEAPTLVCYGQQDIVALPNEVNRMAEKIANITLKEFACAHLMMLEAPQLLARELTTFLNA